MDRARVQSISIISYYISAKYVKLVLRVQGRTRFLHSLCDSEAPMFLKSSRYSKLLDFHNSLVSSNRGIRLPKFPPKKYIKNKSEDFLRDRINKLNRYLEQVMRIRSVQSSEEVFKLVSPKKTYSIGLFGSDVLDFQMITSVVMDQIDSLYLSSPKDSVFESNICRVPIDLLVKNKLKRVTDIVCPNQFRNFSEMQHACQSLDVVGILYTSDDESSESTAWQIEEKLWGIVPSLVMPAQLDPPEHILESVKNLFSLIK